MIPTLFTLVHDHLLFVIATLQEADETDFGELGRLLLLGFAAAVVIALAFTFVKLRLQEKSPTQKGFISIGTTQTAPRREPHDMGRTSERQQ